jgi:3-oxoadipate enol-lactonase
LALLDHLGIDKAYVGGMSQGGFISLRVALTAPGRVLGLILIDTQAGGEDAAAVEGYNGMRAVWMEHGPAPVQDVIKGLILGPGEWKEWTDKWAVLDRDNFSLAFDCLIHRDDITSRLGEITAPALIVHGTADQAIPVEKAEVMRDGLVGATSMCLVDGAAHAPNVTHADVVNPAIIEFLRNN